MRVSQINHKEIAECAKLHQECFENSWSVTDFQSLLKNNNITFLGIFDINMLVGVIAFISIIEEAEIYTLFVKKDYQQRGIASQLLMALETALDNKVSRIVLEVAENNISARKLYEKNGFYEYQRRPYYYKTEYGRVDAILMRKTILL